jgi:hypothetical protein
MHRVPWFDEECSQLVERRKQAKLRWLQDPSEVNDIPRVMQDGKLADISGKRKRNICKTELTSLNQTVRIRISENCTGE